jgi:squalene-associated FAD-dependent desaturase
VGGRARSQSILLGGHPLALDNGQHLLIGAYHRVLALRHTVQAAPDTLERHRLFLESTRGISLRTDRWPGRLGLLEGLLHARGLNAGERLRLIGLIGRLPPDQDNAWAPDLTVDHWLHQMSQPVRLIEQLWRPLCVGALNTPMEQACARTFARVLRDSFRGGPRDSDLLIPRGPLGEVWPAPAHRWLIEHGAQVRLGVTAKALQAHAHGKWVLEVQAGERLHARHLILALPAPQTARVLAAGGLHPSESASLLQRLNDIRLTPIATLWMGWTALLSLPRMVALNERPERPGQWLFDRRDALANSSLQSLASVVVSAPDQHWEDPERLKQAVIRQVGEELDLPEPDAVRVIIERRATPACTPDRPRFEVDALQGFGPGVWLAGDWVWHTYPGTLEGAVRSGETAAERVLEALSVDGVQAGSQA